MLCHLSDLLTVCHSFVVSIRCTDAGTIYYYYNFTCVLMLFNFKTGISCHLFSKEMVEFMSKCYSCCTGVCCPSISHVSKEAKFTGMCKCFCWPVTSGAWTEKFLYGSFTTMHRQSICQKWSPAVKLCRCCFRQLLAKFDHLKIGNYYDSYDWNSVLGHYQPYMVKNLLKF